MKTPKILSSRLAYTGRTIDVVEEKIELSNGTAKTFVRVTHPGAVVILPLTTQGGVLMLRQYRHALLDFLYELPAGTLNHDEHPRECAKRELAEETGMKAESWTDLGILYPAPGFCNEKQHLFAAANLSPFRLEQDEDEIIEVQEWGRDKLGEMIDSGVLCDAKSLSAILRAVRLGIFEM
jgi:ADP-ribose pyrophosphatase